LGVNPTETMNPFIQLTQWISEERLAGIPFSHGAVLGTVGHDGIPKTRMLGVHFDQEGVPRFHTSPTSRKVADIEINRHASITFAFQRSLRSVSIEGLLEEIPHGQLMSDWLALDPKFRRSYHIFGHCSGESADSDVLLEQLLRELSPSAENEMPPSFIGYRFSHVSRIAFYSVGIGNFAEHVVFTRDEGEEHWVYSRVVP
jgi:pyridoxine/pyridoxamine 5'-phosphate oxidase